jgi:hypothetical protein
VVWWVLNVVVLQGLVVEKHLALLRVVPRGWYCVVWCGVVWCMCGVSLCSSRDDKRNKPKTTVYYLTTSTRPPYTCARPVYAPGHVYAHNHRTFCLFLYVSQFTYYCSLYNGFYHICIYVLVNMMLQVNPVSCTTVCECGCEWVRE